MKNITKKQSRRSFLKATALSGGGLMLSFNWFQTAKAAEKLAGKSLSEQWTELASYIKITPDNVIKIFNPNPEFGQNVMTSLPMIVAEELDINWEVVEVKMGPHDNVKFGPQFTGGSNSVRMYWKPLRIAGATARQMLVEAAAQEWDVPAEEISTKTGMLLHEKSMKAAKYGEFASKAALLPVPESPKMKAVKDFSIISNSQMNVEGLKIITGKPLFGIDYHAEGMKIAMVQHPPAFGMKLKSFDASAVKKMPGIQDVFSFKLYNEGFEQGSFDTRTFNEMIAVVGDSTWAVMNARKKLDVQWEAVGDIKENINVFRVGVSEVSIPGRLETTSSQYALMAEYSQKPAQQLRKDGDPETAFKNAAQVIERTYTAPFLPHNCMEPMNFFADVKEESALIAGPLQAPGWIKPTLAKILNLTADKIEIQMTRMGGGFGRRAYPQYAFEAALISQKVKFPVKLIYTREDDMTYGIYRPMYTATYRAALDENKNLIGMHIIGGGIPESPIHENRFPAGAVDNYLAESFAIPSNITVGAFRAPRSNFNAAAEQSFLDEVAEAMGKDPIEMRLELLDKAAKSPVGERNDYDAARYADVLKLLREKANWKGPKDGKYSRGVAAYFCHNSYAGHVVDVVMKDGKPYVEKVTSAVDCGVVINPDAAINMVQGAVVDGIGNAFYGGLKHKDGVSEQNNFDTYRMIRHNEAPQSIEVHFVQNEIDPTGLGEPPFPPVFAAVANAIYQETGKRHYHQPFMTEGVGAES